MYYQMIEDAYRAGVTFENYFGKGRSLMIMNDEMLRYRLGLAVRMKLNGFYLDALECK
jgi:hypothetical protein